MNKTLLSHSFFCERSVLFWASVSVFNQCPRYWSDPVYAAGILAEIGPIERFSDETKLAKYAGLYWQPNQSGKSEYENTSMAKRGNHYLRYYLVEATNSVRRYEAEYNAYYKKKYAETPKHKHKRVIALIARKFMCLVDKLLRNHQLYMPLRSVIDK